MNIIKGFGLKRSLYIHTPGTVAGIGELSGVGFTFSKEPRVYSNTVDTTISLAHFPSKDSDVGYDSPIPDAQRDHVLKVIGAVYDKMLSSPNAPVSPGEYVTAVVAVMGTAVADITVGAQVRSGQWYGIEWISWRNTGVAIDNINKIWFADEAFRGQHDEHEYTVVLPFEPADLFFGHPDDVKALLKSLTYSQEIERIQTARGEALETYLWGKTYDYVNPANKQDRTPAKFSVLIYGASGINEDLIKEAIIEKLLDGSAYTRDQWKEILPDLFRRTEFLIFPQYDKIAIENLANALGVFSPVLNPQEAIDQLVRDSFEYDANYVKQNASVFAFPYQSVGLHVIGNVENRDDKTQITDWYPDYFFTSITSYDFGRMSETTREWVKHIHGLIDIASKLTTSQSVPQGYSRVTRGTISYLARSFQEVNWLVALKNQG